MVDEYHKLNNDDIKLTTIRLDFEKLRPIFICALYRPPTGNIINFNDLVIELLDNLTPARKFDVFIGGDFNIDYARSSPNKKYLKELESRFGLTQMIHDKTRPLYSNTIVDLILTNNPTDTISGTLDLNISDHLPVWAIRKKMKVKPVTSEFIGRTYKNYNKNILEEDLRKINWHTFLTENDLNIAWNFFVKSILQY